MGILSSFKAGLRTLSLKHCIFVNPPVADGRWANIPEVTWDVAICDLVTSWCRGNHLETDGFPSDSGGPNSLRVHPEKLEALWMLQKPSILFSTVCLSQSFAQSSCTAANLSFSERIAFQEPHVPWISDDLAGSHHTEATITRLSPYWLITSSTECLDIWTWCFLTKHFHLKGILFKSIYKHIFLNEFPTTIKPQCQICLCCWVLNRNAPFIWKTNGFKGLSTSCGTQAMEDG